jgi:putative phosphoesterase
METAYTNRAIENATRLSRGKAPAGDERSIAQSASMKVVTMTSSGNIEDMIERPSTAVLGLISDTHGLVRPSVHEALAGVDLILHAGDVGWDEILDELRIIAPVQAVYGNTDDMSNPNLLMEILTEIGGLSIHVSHGHELGSPTPERLVARYPQDVIVYGHTHKQLVTRIGKQLVINPGAAGQQRFKLLPTVARLTIANGAAEVETVALA